jgi:hypothetical protein
MSLSIVSRIYRQIPEELAVVCFDDMPWAISLRPPLTAVLQPAEELGRTAAQLLLERLKDPNRLVRQVVLPTRLIVRASCGARNGLHAQWPAGLHPTKTGGATKHTIPKLQVEAASFCEAASPRSFTPG